MEATLTGKNGPSALPHVEAEGALATDNAPILCHNMVEKTVRTLDHLLKQKNAVRTSVQVDIAFWCVNLVNNRVTTICSFQYKASCQITIPTTTNINKKILKKIMRSKDHF